MKRYSIVGATIEIVRSIGAVDIKAIRTSNIIFATLSQEQVNILKSKGYYVEPVVNIRAGITPIIDIAPPAPIEAQPIYTPAQLFTSIGFEQARQLTDPPLTGSGINVAVIDSGVRADHQSILGRVVYSKNFTTSRDGDNFNHGTGIASCILTAAPDCNIIDFKVIEDAGSGSVENLILAIDECVSMHEDGNPFAPSIINLSIGAPDDGNPNDPLKIMCREAATYGIWIVAAAGNSGPDMGTMLIPAAERYVLAVGSCSYDPFVVSPFSSRGPTLDGIIKPDLVFFGENIVVASSVSTTANIAKSGTSFSAPFVTGLMALYQQAVIIYAQAKYPEEIFGPMSYEDLLSMRDLIDIHLKQFCVKPSGIVGEKDVYYGEGLPYGPLFNNAFSESEGDATTSQFDSGLITSMMTIAMMVPIFGMIGKS